MAKLADVKKAQAGAAEPTPMEKLREGVEAKTAGEVAQTIIDIPVEPGGAMERMLEEAPKTAPEASSAASTPEGGAKGGGRPKAAKGSPKAAATLGALAVEDEKVNICYYGPEGTGKTTDLAFMAKLGRILVVNAEGGLVGRRLKRLGVPTENVQVWPDPSTGEAITYGGLEELFWRIKSDLMEDPESWAGVAFDSGTEIVAALVDNQRAVALEKAERAGKERDRFFTDIADYGVMTSQMRDLLRKFRDLPCHFVITALERRDTDDDGAVLYGPAVTPALIADIAGYVGIVIHTRIEEYDGEEVFVGKTRRSGSKYRAKDRYGVLPPLMVSPTFDRIVAYVNEEITKEHDPLQAQARARAEAAKAAEAERKASGVKKTSRS